MAKKDIEIGLDAAGEDDKKTFNPDDTDARKKRIEEARKLLEDYPAEDVTEEEKPVEEAKTTPSGVIGAVTRGAAPYATGALAGAAIGAPLAGIGSAPGALAGMTAVALSDLAVGGVNAAFGTHYTSPKEAVTHALDYFGTPKPESKAEKVIEAATDYATSGYGVAGGLGSMAEVMPIGKAKSFFTMMGEAPETQAAVSGIAGGVQEKTTQEYGPLAGIGAGLATGVGLGAAAPALTAGGKAALSALKDVNVPAIEKSLNVLKEFAAPKVEVPTPTITETAAKALRGKESAKEFIAEAAKGEVPISGVTPSQVASELGLTQVPQEFISGSPEYQALARKASAATESTIAARQKDFLSQLSDKTNQILESAGAKKDLSGLSDEVKESILNQVKQYNADEDVLYNQISNLVKVSDEAPAVNSLREVNSRISDLRGREDQLSPIEQSIKKFLSPNQKGENPSIAAIYDLKKKVGAFLDKEYTFPTETVARAKRYYGLLSDDYFEALSKYPNAEELTKKAFALTKERKGIEDSAINLFGEKLANSISGKITRATQAAAKGDAEKIRGILNSVPEKYKADVIASGINNAITKGGKLDVDEFVKWYSNLQQNKSAYNSLFEQLPESSKYQVDNLYVMSKNIQNALGKEVKVGDLKEAINSSVGLASKIKKIGTSLIAGSLAYKASQAVGVPSELSHVLMTAVTGATLWDQMAKSSKVALSNLDDFLTSGEFARYIANAKGNPEVFSRSVPQMMREPFYQNFAKQVGPETAKRILLEATQIPSKGETEITQQ